MTVYLLHLDPPLHHAKHYLGWADDLEERLDKHRKGEGARLLQVQKERGGSFILVRTWEADRVFESRLKKKYKNSCELCPVCNPKAFQHFPVNN